MNEIKQTLQQDADALLKRLQQSRKNGTGVTLSVSDVGVLCEEIDSLKAQLEQVKKVWILTDFMLPDEDEAVLFLDKNNTIHDGYLSTDYVDGPYGENGEDFGDNQTLWSSNSNGEEFLPSEIKYWMPRPSSESGSSAGELNEH